MLVKMASEQSLYESLMEPISMVEESLFIGNRAAAQELPILQMCEISSVVQVQSFPTAAFHPTHFRYLCLTLTDLEEDSLVRFLPSALSFIHREITAGRKVFVHCDAGVSRSGSIVTAYIMATHHLSFENALQFVQQKRPCVSPNEGFQNQLKALSSDDLERFLHEGVNETS